MKAITAEQLNTRKGFSKSFLGKGFSTPFPKLPAKAKGILLPYTHFSVIYNLERKTAWFTAVNINGEKAFTLRRMDSNERWFLDPRLDKSAQLGDDFYVKNKLDKGHLVRRLDPVWGDEAEATMANDDTFFYPNASPQHEKLNRVEWSNLEDYLLNNSIAHRLRINVLTGPVFREQDIEHREAQVPEEFWKIVVMVKTDTKEMSATAYLLTQRDLLSDLEAFTFGEFKIYQSSLKKIEELTQMDFGKLKNHDPKSEFESAIPFKEIKGFNDIIF